ncbi:sigma-70 family RNA polymerase sigma factor [Nocardioides sp.]|uniref:sigma-70 family RNA polymerase sigma factor n=1 Tax=Nocardioides sp. TaxID=35761 RepID=UPI003D0C795D
MSALSDAELIRFVRSGDDAAASELFARHRDAGIRLGAALAGRSHAEDLVSEAFVRLLVSLRNGGGPERAFRPYLLSTIRNLFVDELRRAGREIPVDEFSPDLDELVEPDQFEARFESTIMARAFRSLPGRWQEVLWHTSVEGEPLSVVATHLGMNANSVAALSFRAREGLRRAYLAEHLAQAADASCAWVIERLPRHARGALTPAEVARVDKHLETCVRCPSALLELRAINSHLGGLLLPALVGTSVSLRSYLPASPWAGISAAVGGVVVAVATVAAVAVGVTGADPVSVPSVHAEPTSVAAPRQAVQPAPTLRHRPAQAPSTTRGPRVPSSRPSSSSPSPRGHFSAHNEKPPPSAPSSQPTSPTAQVSSTPAPVDVTLGEAWLRPSGTFRHGIHVQVPVISAGLAALTLRVSMSGVEDYEVHSNGAYGRWTCQPDGPALVCTLPASEATEAPFAMDLRLAEGKSGRLVFDVDAPDRADPDPADNRLVLGIDHPESPDTSAGEAAIGMHH